MIAEALQSLRPGARFRVDSEGVIYWQDQEQSQPSDSEIQTEATRLQADYDLMEYSRKRKSEYPLLDDVTVALAEKAEGRSEMWDEITVKRATVRAKYPKP